MVLAPAEEARNTPLGGPAGDLLDKIVTGGMKLKPAQTALISLVQCRPPQDRPPTADEIRLCSPWAQRQLELLQAKVLVPKSFIETLSSEHALPNYDATLQMP